MPNASWMIIGGELLCACLVATANAATPERVADQPLLRELAASASPTELRASIVKLVGFGTRHTLSDTRSDSRGIGAAPRGFSEGSKALETAAQANRRRYDGGEYGYQSRVVFPGDPGAF